MTTQYTTILKLALPVQGELSGTWGDVVNDNITQMVEQAVAGKAVVNTWTGNSHTLTTADGTTSESRCAILELTDTGTALTGAGTVVCPTNTKLYIVDNNTAEIITVQTAAGTGVAVPVGKTMLVYCDGTNVVEGVTHANSLSLGTSTVTADKILDEDNMASDSATAIATQQSIKAYVDSQVGSFDTLAEVLAQGNTTGGTDLAVSTGDDITFADSSKAIFGADSDLQIYSDGTTGQVTGNVNVTGTVTADGLTVDGLAAINSTTPEIRMFETDTTDLNTQLRSGVGKFEIKTLNDAVTLAKKRFEIDHATGDISFYEDTGTTPKFFWDASEERLGIGTSSPTQPLNVVVPDNSGVQIESGAGEKGYLFFGDDASNTVGRIGYDHDTDAMGLWTASAEVVVIDSSGIDVTGSVTAEGLTVNSGAGDLAATFQSTDQFADIKLTDSGGSSYVRQSNGSLLLQADRDNASASSIVQVSVDGVQTARFTAGGDISFYEDTGTTPKFFWDASAETLTVGGDDSSTSSGLKSLILGEYTDSGSGAVFRASDASAINFEDSNASTAGRIYYNHTSDYMAFNTASVETMRIDASGNVNVTGTADSTVRVEATSGNDASLFLTEAGTGNVGAQFVYDGGDNNLYLKVGNNSNTNRLSVSRDTGSISFYEDTGTTPKFFWDASAESLQLGSTAPQTPATFNLRANGTNIEFGHGNRTSGYFGTLGASANNGKPYLGFSAHADGGSVNTFTTKGFKGNVIEGDTSGNLTFNQLTNANASGQNLTERLRIDASGNVLVGQSSTALPGAGNTTEGISVSGQYDAIFVSRASGSALVLNRNSEGSIQEFRKDGTTVGAIGAQDGDLVIYSTTAGHEGLRLGNGAIVSTDNAGATTDAACNLGGATSRFTNLYLSGGAYLGGTGAANLLDDYEEGTWTPAYTGTTGGVVTYGTQTGSYTKVGNLVTVIGELRAKRNTLSGNVEITGLPFTESGSGAGLSVNFASAFATDMPNLKGYTTSTKIVLRKNATNSASGTPVANTDLANAATTDNYFYFSVTYLT